MFTSFSHLTLFVNDQNRALDFYQKVGFKIHTDALFGPMRWLTLCLPEQPAFELVIMLAETDAEKALVGKQGGDKPFFTLATTDCQEDCERLKAAGVVFVQEPKHEPWGTTAAFQDVCGNTIYVCQSR